MQISATPQQRRTVGDGLQGVQGMLRRVLPALAPAAAAINTARHADEVCRRRRRHDGVQRRAALVALIQIESQLSFESASVPETSGGVWGAATVGSGGKFPQSPRRQGIDIQVCVDLIKWQPVADNARSPASL
jgi:hypothetical protein